MKRLLYPFAGAYLLITDVRNWLYETGYKHSYQFPIPTISVGNLAAGGTGKTPHVEYLIDLLKNEYRLATLSRGYGRKTSGFIVASDQSDAAQIGDEPLQLYRKFGAEITVSVGEKRAEAIPEIIHRHPETDVILLDDAFQHRAVRPSLSILLTDYRRPFYADYGLPAGYLREHRRGASRADVIIVSKCPDELPEPESKRIVQHIRKYARPETPVFFTGIHYGAPVAFSSHSVSFSPRVLLVTGIADASPLVAYVQATYNLAKHLTYGDHHAYTPADVDTIRNALKRTHAQAILTTEKDFVKLGHPTLVPAITTLPFFYLPMRIYFLFDQARSFNKIVGHVVDRWAEKSG